MKGHHKPLRLALISAILALGCTTPQAEDIDLFNVTTDPVAGPKPNVLFVLDNTANWDSTLTDADGNQYHKEDAIHDALYRLAADNGWSEKIRMGIMTLANSNNPQGGRLLHAIGDLNTEVKTPSGTLSGTNQQRLLSKIYQPGIKTISNDTGTPVDPATIMTNNPQGYWCNEWLDKSLFNWTNYRTNPSDQEGEPDYVVIYNDKVGNDCYKPYPTAIMDDSGRGYVKPHTDPDTGYVSYSLTASPTGNIWDPTSGDLDPMEGVPTGMQFHYYLDMEDVHLVTNTSMLINPEQYAAYPPSGEPDPYLPYISANGTIKTTQLSQIEKIGEPFIPKSNNKPFALTMHEAYLYLNGDTIRSGLGDGWYDVSNNKGADNWQWYDLKSQTWTSAFNSDNQYRSPINDANACARTFIIFIGNGRLDSGENKTAEPLLRGLNGVLTTDPVSLSPDNYESNWTDEYARFIYARDFSDTQTEKQSATTFVIDVFDPDSETNVVDLAARAFLKSVANQGKGRYFAAKTSDEIYNAMEQALLDILAVNSVFASTTLPVSVNVRGTNLNQVYMGVFRPDKVWLPRWMGNLKLYQLALDQNGALYLADADDKKADDTVTGFLVDDAKSFWTFDDTVDYWDFNDELYPNHSDSPDGKDVEKGAAAQRIRKDVISHISSNPGAYSTSRTLYTCPDGTCTDILPFNISNVGDSDLGITVADTYTSEELIDWVYGKRKATDLTTLEGNHAVRASVHGDVLHSRPAVIGYNVDNENDVIAYYGANDGIFHAVKGGKTSDALSQDGHERWGLIFPEFLPRLKELYENTEIETDRTSPDYNPKPYFADGSIGIFRVLDPSTGNPTTVHLFVTMRRGGRFIYALNVSPSTAGTPPTGFNVLWKKSSTDYPELGQTWSEPKVARLKDGDSFKNVIIFGGGYDPDFDDVYPRDLANANQGRDIFILDAVDGSLIWQASAHMDNANNNFVQEYPIPSDVSVIDLNGDGYADTLYVGDTGGNIWRIKINDIQTSAGWSVNKLASVGSDSKFLYAPDVVQLENGNLAILIGSGNREDPRSTLAGPVGHLDKFYMFQDSGSNTINMLAENTMVNVTNGAEVDLSTADGWYLELGTGEKVVSNAVTLNGVTFFNTSQVVEDDNPLNCSSNLGTARAYHVSFTDGSADNPYEVIPGGGLPPSPVPVIVELIPDNEECQENCDDLKRKVEAIVSGTTVMTPPGSKLDVRERRYWFEEIE